MSGNPSTVDSPVPEMRGEIGSVKATINYTEGQLDLKQCNERADTVATLNAISANVVDISEGKKPEMRKKTESSDKEAAETKELKQSHDSTQEDLAMETAQNDTEELFEFQQDTANYSKISKKRGSKRKKRRSEKVSTTGDDSEWEDKKPSCNSSIIITKSQMSAIVEAAVAKVLAVSIKSTEDKFNRLLATFNKSLTETQEGIAYRDEELKTLQDTTEKMSEKLKEVEGRLLRNEKLVNDIKEENIELKCRSMRENVIFYNIAERQDRLPEDCFGLLHGFFHAEMKDFDSKMQQLQLFSM